MDKHKRSLAEDESRDGGREKRVSYIVLDKTDSPIPPHWKEAQIADTV